MTLFKIQLEDCGYFCIDLDTISSFYIGVGNKLKILPIGGSEYITPITICPQDAKRLLEAWENRQERINHGTL